MKKEVRKITYRDIDKMLSNVIENNGGYDVDLVIECLRLYVCCSLLILKTRYIRKKLKTYLGAAYFTSVIDIDKGRIEECNPKE